MNIELTSSEPVVEKPAVAPSEETPPAVEPEKTPAADTEPVLYELPDGRKVDAEGLRTEYLNILPEFTRKSQELALLKEGKGPKPDTSEPEWKKPEWTPKSYAEIVELAEKSAIERIQETARAEEARRAEVAKTVDSQIAALKAKDPKLDESALFAHANKYGFQDLTLAHANMMDSRNAVLSAEQRAVKNLKGRVDPVAGGSSTPTPSGTIDYASSRNYSSATEFMAQFKKPK